MGHAGGTETGRRGQGRFPPCADTTRVSRRHPSPCSFLLLEDTLMNGGTLLILPPPGAEVEFLRTPVPGDPAELFPCARDEDEDEDLDEDEDEDEDLEDEDEDF